jgi:membrane-bound lytic murein transglycosylase D
MAISRLPILGTLFFALAVPPGAPAFQNSDSPSASSDNPSSNSDAAEVPFTDTNTERYLEAVSRTESKPDRPFRPTASDLLIQQAEEKLQQGRDAYRLKDSPRARREFDSAVLLMLQASDEPSDRTLYETKMEDMIDSIHRLDLAGLGAATPPSEGPQFEKAPIDELLELTFPVDPKLKNKVQSEISATTSQLPLTMNDSILGFINYFSGKGHRTIVAGLERAGKYKPMIQRVLAEEGVPQELIYLAQAESGFMPRAISNKAAAGMWQFVKFRGQEYGLNQTAFTDDRLDPEKATRAAARHLKDLYTQFGNWYLAIAAYNCGPGNVSKAVERTGYADFFELRDRHVLPKETTNYVPIILAMTIMSKNAKEYGLEDLALESPLEYDTVSMTAATHLQLIGDMTDTPISQLQMLNPALLKNIAPDGYEVRVPRGSGETLTASLETIPGAQRASWRMHRVETGDTLTGIAKRYGTTAKSISDANKMNGTEPSAGDHLIIPATYHAPVAKAPTASKAAVHRTSAHHPTGAVIAQTHTAKPTSR